MTSTEPAAPVPSGAHVQTTRAGRNLTQAVVVGMLLAGLVLLSLLVQKVAFVALAGVAVTIAVWEMANAFAERDIRMPAVPVTVGGVAMIVAAYFGGPEPLVIALLLTALGAFAWRLPAGAEGYLRDTSAGVFTAMYGPFLAGTAMLMLRPEDGPLRIVVFVVVTVCSDIGGYAVGSFLGRHPMAPTVSPKKSWEGFAGSLVFCVVGGACRLACCCPPSGGRAASSDWSSS
jgi:phosphatidate cytidylyltransferase